MPADPATAPLDLRAWLIDAIARRTGADPADIDPRQPFTALGLGSRDAVELCGELQALLGRPVSPLLVWRHPTVDALADHFAAPSGGRVTAGPSGT
ncbi:acyl carrier protein [Nocardiopsis trehalosi]|jgi:acyl carrier protein|uniref:acyl carrier protein n=1 Tax=Nocardiopsis trehalosi TaxID=109329 RepID=UPI00082DEE8C|nr:acyl carrier protein [Nocardiopsis trehalosi]